MAAGRFCTDCEALGQQDNRRSKQRDQPNHVKAIHEGKKMDLRLQTRVDVTVGCLRSIRSPHPVNFKILRDALDLLLHA